MEVRLRGAFKFTVTYDTAWRGAAAVICYPTNVAGLENSPVRCCGVGVAAAVQYLSFITNGAARTSWE